MWALRCTYRCAHEKSEEGNASHPTLLVAIPFVWLTYENVKSIGATVSMHMHEQSYLQLAEAHALAAHQKEKKKAYISCTILYG